MNENIAVFCRLRSADYSYMTIDPHATHLTLELAAAKSEVSPKNSQKTFVLNKVFTVDNSSQDSVYQESASTLVNDFLLGYNCALMAYGGTGSGKTYTMLGVITSQNLKGIIPRAIEQIKENAKVEVTVSFIEIYNELVFDLLAPKKTPLKIVEATNNMKVQKCTEVVLANVKEMHKMAERAFSNRTMAETLMNVESSRSHAVVIFKSKGASLFLVDLAGAEDQADTGSSGTTLKQASAINKSLSELTNVMNALYQKNDFINYRNSKLTTLLKKALGGNSKTTFMLTINPVPKQLQMNLRTLQFGNRARSLTNNAKLITQSSSSDLTDWQSKYQEDLAGLESKYQSELLLWQKKYEEAATRLEEQAKAISSLHEEGGNHTEEKKNLDPTLTNGIIGIKRRASIYLEEHDKTNLEEFLNNHEAVAPTPSAAVVVAISETKNESDSESDTSCPPLILTEAALQRMVRTSVIQVPSIKAKEPEVVPAPVPPSPKPPILRGRVIVPPIEIPKDNEDGKVVVVEPITTPVVAARNRMEWKHENAVLEDVNHELEVRLYELEQKMNRTTKAHYPTTVWGTIGFYICIIVVIIGLCMIYYAHMENNRILHKAVAWATMLGGVAFLVCCLYD